MMEETGEAIEGFDAAGGARMRETGLAEEVERLRPAPGGEASHAVTFTASALADWDFLHGSRIVGAPMQLDAILAEGLAVIARGRIPAREIESLGGDGAIWHQRGLRWVIRWVDEDRSVVVHGIAQARLNPFRKIWRYFDQEKAVDLLRTSELYLCRVDRLADEFEARPTEAMQRARDAAFRSVFGADWPGDPHWYENIRRALYVTCFQKREIESAEMWRDYCPSGGGLAIQVTERTLQHEVARLRPGRRELFLRDIEYIDHGTHEPASQGVPEQAFFKRMKFRHEREIRLAWFLPEMACGTQDEIERFLRGLPPGKRVPIQLEAAVESVVLNPAGSAAQRAVLQEALANQPALRARQRESTLLPV